MTSISWLPLASASTTFGSCDPLELASLSHLCGGKVTQVGDCLKLVYFGTPTPAVDALKAVVAAGHEVMLVVTQPDRRRGRGTALSASPVKVAAEVLGLAVATPERASEITDTVRDLKADLGIVVAFGQILPTELLDAIPGGFVNVHYSLLPRWRGAAPVERAMLAGDRDTGVCVMGVEAGLDTGPVYSREVVPIEPVETAGALHARLTSLGAALLVRTLAELADIVPEVQAGETTYAAKLTVEEFQLDLTRPVEELLRLVRAGNPRPGAWLTVDGARLKVWQAHGDDGRFVPDAVQPEGKRSMLYSAWRAGHRDTDPFA